MNWVIAQSGQAVEQDIDPAADSALYRPGIDRERIAVLGSAMWPLGGDAGILKPIAAQGIGCDRRSCRFGVASLSAQRVFAAGSADEDGGDLRQSVDRVRSTQAGVAV